MKQLTIITFLVLFSCTSYAEHETSKKEIVEELLVVTDCEALIDSMYAQMGNLFAGMSKDMGMREAEQPQFEKFMNRFMDEVKKEMTWEKMKDPMIEIYMNHYTRKELSDLLVFYKTESGKSVVKKMPLVMQDSMQLSRDMLTSFLPRVRQIGEEMRQEIIEARQQESSKIQ